MFSHHHNPQPMHVKGNFCLLVSLSSVHLQHCCKQIHFDNRFWQRTPIHTATLQCSFQLCYSRGSAPLWVRFVKWACPKFGQRGGGWTFFVQGGSWTCPWGSKLLCMCPRGTINQLLSSYPLDMSMGTFGKIQNQTASGRILFVTFPPKPPPPRAPGDRG